MQPLSDNDDLGTQITNSASQVPIDIRVGKSNLNSHLAQDDLRLQKHFVHNLSAALIECLRTSYNHYFPFISWFQHTYECYMYIYMYMYLCALTPQ